MAARVNDSAGRWRTAGIGLFVLLIAWPGAGYERIQTHGRRVWIGPSDVMALTEPERDRVALLDASGDRPRKLGEFGEQGADPWQLMGPHGAIVTPWGELVVADSFNYRIQSFDAGALRAGLRPPLLRVWSEAGGYAKGLNAPMALCARPGSDRIYVADTRNHRIVEFDKGGRATGRVIGAAPDSAAGSPRGTLGWPSALAFDRDGRTLYVAEQWSARVSAFDADTGRLLFARGPAGAGEPGIGIPGGLAVSGDDLLVTDVGGHRVVRLRVARGADGRPRALREARAWGRAGRGPGEFQYPQSIAADSRGRIYVCERIDSRCQMFSPEGRVLAPFGEDWQPPEWTAPPREPSPNGTGWRDVRSGAGAPVLRVRSDPEPIPLNEPFELVVERQPGGDGRPDERLRVDAVMPEHRHGMNTQPRVERGDAGRYRVKGLLFHMSGHWEVHFDILRAGVWERAQWDVEVE